MFPVSANHKSILSTHLYTKCSLYLLITKVFFLHTFIQNVLCICQSQKYSFYTPLYKMFPVSVNHKSIPSTHLYTKCSLYLPITKAFLLHTFFYKMFPCICQSQKYSFYTPLYKMFPVSANHKSILSTHLYTKCSLYLPITKVFFLHTFIQNVPCICQSQKYSFYTPLYKMFPVSVNHKIILSIHLYTKCSLYLLITKLYFLHTFIQNVPCICQSQKYSFYTPLYKMFPVSANHKSIPSTHLFLQNVPLYLPITKIFFLHTFYTKCSPVFANHKIILSTHPFYKMFPCICQSQKHSFYTLLYKMFPCICQLKKYSFYTLLYKMFPCICQSQKYSFYTPYIQNVPQYLPITKVFFLHIFNTKCSAVFANHKSILSTHLQYKMFRSICQSQKYSFYTPSIQSPAKVSPELLNTEVFLFSKLPLGQTERDSAKNIFFFLSGEKVRPQRFVHSVKD